MFKYIVRTDNELRLQLHMCTVFLNVFEKIEINNLVLYGVYCRQMYKRALHKRDNVFRAQLAFKQERIIFSREILNL